MDNFKKENLDINGSLKEKPIKKLTDRNIKSKKGRLVIRNLSYKASEEALKKHFLKFGPIQDVCILKYPDGRMKGVGFLEFTDVVSAVKAIKELNMKLFMGRPIAVDFAIPKQKYEEYKGKPLKKEPPDYIDPNASEMLTNSLKCDASPIKIEEENKDENRQSNNEDESDNIISEDDAMSEDEDTGETKRTKKREIDNKSDEENCDSTSEDDCSENERPSKRKKTFNHNPVSKDILEGKTIFIRNLSFGLTEEKVEEILSEFGEIKYVMFCRDKSTQRFTGSCFAQFMFKEGCDACIEAYEDPAQKSLFKLDGRTLTISRAVGRSEIVKNKDETKGKEKKDTRNLYLAREGVIREGTKPAIGSSKADLILRTQREIVKRKMLMNYNIYVSPTRLCVHNLPLTLNDKELLAIFKKNSPKGSVISEARIMKNLYELDDEGKPCSKGYGFVAFTEHEHALMALRNINNNPSIFTVKQRPIVEFSLENKAALKAKENRLKKSLNNVKQSKDISMQLTSDFKKEESTEFMGSTYDPNKKGKAALSTHIGPKIRHKDRSKNGKISRNQINNQLRKQRKGKNRTKKRGGAPSKKIKKVKKLKKIRA